MMIEYPDPRERAAALAAGAAETVAVLARDLD